MFDSSGNLVWAPANLLLRSENLSLSWLVTDTTLSTDGTLSPSGSLATLCTQGTAGTATVVQVVASLVANASYTESIFFKPGTAVWIRLRMVGVGGTSNVWLNLATGAKGTTTFTGTDIIGYSNIVALPNGWYRADLSATNPTDTSRNVEFLAVTGNGLGTRENGATYYFGGAQLEPTGPDSPKAYNVTTSSAYYGPRFDYNPATLQPRGYLIEAQRTNLMPISTGTPSNWSTTNAAVTTAATNFWNWNAVTVTTTAVGAGQFAFFTTSPGLLLASTRYTSSVFVRKNNYSLIQVSITNNVGLPTGGAWAYANYDFDSDTFNVYGTAGAAVIGSREILSDGIVRIQLSYTTDTAPTAGAGVIISFINTVTAGRLSGTSTLGAAVDVFGAQLEAGNFATSHIPTYGVTATRNGETATLVTPPPYNALGTTYYAEFERQGNPVNSSSEATSSLFYFGDVNTYINGVFGFGTTNQVRSDLGNAGAVQAQVSVSSQLAIPFQVYTWATRHAPNDSVMAANGVLGTVDTAVSMPSSIPTTRLAIGRSNSATTQQMHGWLRELRIYETAAPDGELTRITS